VALGPGSFTGVRIGLAAARALGLAWGVPVLGYPTLALIAAIAQAEQPGEVLVATTGGHGEWFTQGLTHRHGQQPARLAAPRRGRRPALLPPRVAGSQAEALVARRGFGEARALWPDARRLPLLSPAHLGDHLSPIYGRAPDARLPGGLLPQPA
jgi:tRNA threonylcarbamoyl adenosine modification protein YeaZ